MRIHSLSSTFIGNILFFIAIYLSISLSLGQDFTLNLYTPPTNIPSEQIKSIVQDAKGFILLLTPRGIYRFDGNTSKLLVSQTPLSEAKSFYKAMNGKIIILFKEGLYELNESTQNSLVVNLKLMIRCDNPIQVHQENPEKFWISLASGDVILYNIQNTSNYSFEKKGIKKYFLTTESKLIGLVAENGSVYQLKGNRFYEIYRLDANQVKAVVVTKKNTFWLATEKGIISLDFSAPEIKHQKISNSPNNISCFYAFQGDKILLGTQNQGVFQVATSFKDLVFSPFEYSTGLHLSAVPDFQKVAQIYSDREGGIWVLQEKGLAYFKTKAFSSPHKVLAAHQTNSVCQTQNGDMYFASNNEVFRMYKTDSYDKVESIIKISEGAINTIEAQDDKVWVGVVRGVLICLQNGKRISTLDLTKRGGSIFTIYPDQKKRVWFCQVAQENPLPGISYTTDNQTVKYYGSTKGIAGRILAAKESFKKQLYLAGIGSQTYLYLFDEKNDRFINLSLPLPFEVQHFEVHDLVIDKEDNVWLATNYGLLKYLSREKKITRIDLGELMTATEIRAILLDNQEQLWISTDVFGLICYKKGQYTVYTTQNGLSNRVLWYRHIFLDQTNKLWVGAIDDVVVSPELLKGLQKTPIPTLLGINVHNKDLSIPNYSSPKFELSYKADLKVSFKSLSYPNQTITYQYRFKGQDTHWSPNQNNTLLTFSDLNSGNYVLEIRAKQTAYAWSEPLSIEFNVASPWYTSRWAWLIYILLFGLGIWGLVKINSWRLELDKQRLNRIIAQKTEQLFLKNEELEKNHQRLLELNNEISSQNEELHLQTEELSKQRNFIEEKNKEIRLKRDELKSINDNLDKLVKQRTKKIEELNLRIIKYAFNNAHKVRGPIARILGLLNIIPLESDPQKINMYLDLIRDCAQQLDEIVRNINTTLSEDEPNI
jgi:ligand-binding sensor domain-containing protein